MRRIDRLILGELIGPWGFGVAIFTVLIMAGTYLFKLTDYIVSGIDIFTIIRFTLLLLPGIMVKTFSMAALLCTLLAFGRLSSDSEVVAMRAAGASLPRLMMPVFFFGLAVAVLAFAVNETIVPYAAFQGTALKSVIEKKISGGGQPTFTAIYDGKRIKGYVAAKDFNLQQRTLRGVTVVTFAKNGLPTSFLYCPYAEYKSETEWRIKGGGKLISYNGQNIIELGETWPIAAATPPKPADILASTVQDLDTFSMSQMRVRITMAKINPSFSYGQIANLEYGYYNKIALPLAAIIFALVGAPLGIRNHRTGAASGFWLSVIIIFGYMLSANLMAVYAKGGVMPAYVASFTPLVIGLVFAIVLIYRKNV